MSCSTTSLEYGWPTLVRICARIRSLLTVPGPVYSTSIERTMGGPCGAACGACARATVAASSAQMEAAQIANGGGRIHPEKYLIGQEARPRASEPTQDRRLYLKEGVSRQGFSQRHAVWSPRPAPSIQKFIPIVSPARFVTRVANKRFNLPGI